MDPQTSDDTSKTLKDFASQSLALGVVWIIASILMVAVVIEDYVVDSRGEGHKAALWKMLAPLIAAVALGWIAGGVGALLKKRWGIVLGLAFSYLALVFGIPLFRIGGAVVLIALIIQGHRVLGFAKTLRNSGIPLTQQP